MRFFASFFGLCLFCCSLATLAVQAVEGPADPILAERYHQLNKEFRCMVCQNQSLSDSNATLAVDLRKEVQRLLESGMSDQEIRNFLVARYGEYVLYRTPFNKKNALLWLGPGLLLLFAIVLALFSLRRYRLKNSRDEAEQGSENNEPDIEALLQQAERQKHHQTDPIP